MDVAYFKTNRSYCSLFDLDSAFAKNLLLHSIDVLQDIIVSVSDDADSQPFENLLAGAVCLPLVRMTLAVEFNRQTVLVTIEIDDEVPDRMLPTEL